MLNVSDGVLLFTDGSCSTRTRIGGWAWIAVGSDREHLSDQGFVENTTISQMELLAPTHGLQSLWSACGSCEIEVQSDSKYVVLGITNRKRNRNCNLDFWKGLEESIDLHEFVSWRHVKGHSGNRWNEAVDHLAGQARIEGECHVKS